MLARLLRCKKKPATISGSVFPGAGCSTLWVVHQQQPSSQPGLRCAKSHPRKHPGFGALQNSLSSALEFSESDETRRSWAVLGTRGHRHRTNMLPCVSPSLLGGMRTHSRSSFSCTIVQQHLIVAGDYFCGLIYCASTPTIVLAKKKER